MNPSVVNALVRGGGSGCSDALGDSRGKRSQPLPPLHEYQALAAAGRLLGPTAFEYAVHSANTQWTSVVWSAPDA